MTSYVPPFNYCEKSVNSWARLAKRIRVPMGFVFAAFYFWFARPRLWSLAVGIMIAAAGLIVRALASGHVTKNEALTTTGPYAYVRNPLYLGSILVAAGFGVAAWRLWIMLAMVVFFAAIYFPVIRSEENFLQHKFPEFKDYVRHVPRLFPRFTPYGVSQGAFSRDLYLKHHEYNALIGAVLMVLALAAKMVWLAQ